MEVFEIFKIICALKLVCPDVSGSLLICPPCERIHCSISAPSLKCLGGQTTGVCNCCPACAKLEGQKCGGEWNYLGKCDGGLVCKPQISIIKRRVPAGRCIRGHTVAEFTDTPRCQPRCSSEFCSQYPRAICSAVDISQNYQTCQGPCQHTSCRACFLSEKWPQCGDKCHSSDLKCIRIFGRCFKKDSCSRYRNICKTKKVYLDSDVLRCVLPSCKEN